MATSLIFIAIAQFWRDIITALIVVIVLFLDYLNIKD